ncbi:MAG: nucleoside deaminase, partial [Methanothrix sp.]
MNEFMAIALEEAMEGIENDDGGPFGAVIVQDGVVISRAHNEVL